MVQNQYHFKSMKNSHELKNVLNEYFQRSIQEVQQDCKPVADQLFYYRTGIHLSYITYYCNT